MANENTYVVTGLVDQLDNKDIAQAFVEGQTQRAGKPLRVLLKDQSGSAKWYGTFDKNCMRTILNGGEQSGPWTLTCETTYKGTYVNEMIKEAVLTQTDVWIDPGTEPRVTGIDPMGRRFNAPAPAAF